MGKLCVWNVGVIRRGIRWMVRTFKLCTTQFDRLCTITITDLDSKHNPRTKHLLYVYSRAGVCTIAASYKYIYMKSKPFHCQKFRWWGLTRRLSFGFDRNHKQ